MATMEEEEEVVKAGSQQNPPPAQQPSTGPASRAARGSSTSIPFIDCSDVDSEYDLLREQGSQSHSQTNDNHEGDVTSGAYVLGRDENRNEARCRESPNSWQSCQPTPKEYFDDEIVDTSISSMGSPRHSSLVDELFRGPGTRSPLAAPLPPSSRESSPRLSWNRTGSQDRVSENGHDYRDGNVEEALHPCRDPHADQGSPVLQRYCAQNVPKVSNKSETDPFILSQVASPQRQEHRAALHGKGGLAQMAAPEGPGLANGVPGAGQAKQVTHMHSIGASDLMDHVATVQVMEGSTSSGTESSDSEAEMFNVFRHPFMFRNPAVLSSSPIPRNSFPSDCLELEGDVEEDLHISLSDEDGVNIFNY